MKLKVIFDGFVTIQINPEIVAIIIAIKKNTVNT